MTGVLPGLQNQCGALRASRVGSIPTCPRQKSSYRPLDCEKTDRCVEETIETVDNSGLSLIYRLYRQYR